MLFAGRISALLILSSVLSSIAAVTITLSTATEAIKFQITSPPSSETVEKSIRSAITCSEWSIINNGASNWFTCQGEVNTCILDSSIPFWHCGASQSPQTWYTSCYDYPAVFHSGNNNYCPQARPYCGTWSIITDKHTYSNFGCDTTKADKTLMRRPTITVTSTSTIVTAYVGSNGSQDQKNRTTYSRFRLVAAIVGSLVGTALTVAIAVVTWLCIKKMKKNDLTRQTGEVMELDEKERDDASSFAGETEKGKDEEKIMVVEVLEVDKDSIPSHSSTKRFE